MVHRRSVRTVGRMALSCALCAVFAVGGSRATAAAPTDCGFVLVHQEDWLGGQGVDVHSNGANQTTKYSCTGEREVYHLDANPPQYGFGWQCVELVNRLYVARGWSGRLTGGVAKNLYPNTEKGRYPGLRAKPNGSGYIPVPGDMIVHSNGGAGHVAVVDHLEGTILVAVEQNNRDPQGNPSGWVKYNFDPTTGAVSKSRVTISGYIHADKNHFTNSPGAAPPPTVTNPPVVAPPPSTFTIHSAVDTNKCLDVAYDTREQNGGRVQLYQCNNTPLQKWYIGAGSTIRNYYTNRCLDADYAGFVSKANGTVVQQWQCNGQDNQVWHWKNANEPYPRTLQNIYGKCLDANNSEGFVDGTRVQLWQCFGDKNQQWIMQG